MHYADLLRQAERLARLDPKRPKQANLRRAVSSGYYGLFHFLVDQSCRLVIGTQHEQAPYRHVLGRAFSHSAMDKACHSFAGGTLKAAAAAGLPTTFAIAAATKVIADTFTDLQQQRHSADYDLTVRFKRSNVLLLIEQAEDAIEQFKALSASNDKNFFLACLWAWAGLTKR